MIDFFKKILSFFLNGFNIKSLYKSSSISVKGDANNSTLSGRDTNHLVFNNQGNVNINFTLETLYKIHENNLCGLANDFLKEFKISYDINDSSLRQLLSDYGNYKAFCMVVSQVAAKNIDNKDRRLLLSKLLIDKFKEEGSEVDIYLQAIKLMEDLSVRDIKIFSVMTFIMTLTRNLRDETIKSNSNHIINLINDVDKVSEDEIENLNSLRVIYNLFPNQFDDSTLKRIHEFAPELYDNCSLWLSNNPSICNYKVTSIGKVLAKTFYSVNYNLNYEDFAYDKFPLKECDISFKNIYASGDIISQGEVTAGGTMSMGSLR